MNLWLKNLERFGRVVRKASNRADLATNFVANYPIPPSYAILR